jgi:hypothetical protein
VSLTEAEAKTKWCPHVRYLSVFRDEDGKRETAGCFNRGYDDTGLDRSLCIGDACMMWRWHEPWTSSTEEGVGGDLVLRLARKPGEPKRGFCGLAGRPA